MCRTTTYMYNVKNKHTQNKYNTKIRYNVNYLQLLALKLSAGN